MLTNLNCPLGLRVFEQKVVFPYIARAMQRQGYLFHEYIVGSPGEGIRYSTTEPNDGRLSFGILGTLSFIQEGRGGRTPEEGLERRSRSQLASIEDLLSLCATRAEEIKVLVGRERRGLYAAAGSNVVLCMDHFSGPGSMFIPVRRVPSERDTIWQVTPLHDVVKPLVSRRLPSAYVIPSEYGDIRALLERHHVRYEPVRVQHTSVAEVYLVDSVRDDTLESEWHPMPALRVEKRTVTIRQGDLVVPTNQMHSFFLGILLEPESMWGLVKYPGFRSLLASKQYPIVRIP